MSDSQTVGAPRIHLGRSGLEVFPLCLGGNVFGWTADERSSYAVLDAYVDAGGNFIDTADSYTRPNMGRSEEIIGRWMARRRNRDGIVLATKVGFVGGLSRGHIHDAVQASLQRLQTDRIDLYYAHVDDPATPVAETLKAFHELVTSATVGHLGASNLSPTRLRESIDTVREQRLTGYSVLQPLYNLLERSDYEHRYAPIVSAHELAVVPHSGLARGFLTGKYRRMAPVQDGPRAPRIREYMDDRGDRVLAALDQIAAERAVPLATVSLAWLLSQPYIAAPIASATRAEQLQALITAVGLRLGVAELAALDVASRQ
jgi:aryl-alcohol dehydrogenase-like predicted oxidoreductase